MRSRFLLLATLCGVLGGVAGGWLTGAPRDTGGSADQQVRVTAGQETARTVTVQRRSIVSLLVVDASVETGPGTVTDSGSGLAASEGLYVRAPLTPEQLNLLPDTLPLPKFKIEKGPAGQGCRSVKLERLQDGGEEAASSLVCALPKRLRAYPGQRAQVALTLRAADNVLSVPVTAVEGTTGNGRIAVRRSDGSTVDKTVRLGVSDGSYLEVHDGVSAGDTVLDPYPSLFREPGSGS
jgi:hypothetical protein